MIGDFQMIKNVQVLLISNLSLLHYHKLYLLLKNKNVILRTYVRNNLLFLLISLQRNLSEGDINF